MNERIRQLRKELDLTMERFGKKLGVTRTAISNIESGNRNLTEQMIKSVCREFNVNEEWLRTGQGEMFKQLTNQEELMKYTALLLKDNKSAVASAIQALIVTYEQLDDSNKEVLERVALQYIEKFKKEPIARLFKGYYEK